MIRKSPIFGKFVPSIKNAAVCVSSSGALSIEELIKAKPNIVFLTENAGSAQLQQIQQMGMPVALLKANSIKNLVERAVITGQILGEDAHSRALKYVEYSNNNVKRVASKVSRIPPKQRIRVYHSMGNPLTTANGPSLVQDWMDLAGVINVAEGWKVSGAPGMQSRNVDFEQIIAANPDVIVCMNAADANTIRTSPAWKSIQAVKSGKVYVNPQGMFFWCRETTEEALQFLWLAKTVYPSYFQDVDMAKETRYFYKTFYGYNLSDEDVHLFLNPR
jgi:iron complex transport system substrate-binding protein